MKLTKKILFSMSLMAGLALNAQEFKEREATPVASETDGGVEAVREAQKEPIQPPNQQPDSQSPITAHEQLKKFMDNHKGFKHGWDEGKKRYLIIQVEQFDCESPAADPGFLVKREMLIKQAILEAKIKIIESINSTMSAHEQLDIPGNPLREKFEKKIEEAENNFNLMKSRFSRMKKKIDKSEVDMLSGVTWSDRKNALMDAIIKKIDKQFDTGKIEAKKKAKYEKSKAAYLKGKTEMAEVEKKAAALKGSLQSEMSSSVTKIARMPLFGATVIAQAESWDEDEEKYQVAVLVCWSNSLHRAARAIATGEDDFKIKLNNDNNNKLDVREWLKKQNLAVMSGARQYLDDKGNRWYLGISARALPKASSRQRKARLLAESFASQMAVFCVYADLASAKTAGQMSQTRNSGDKDDTKVAESMVAKLSQSFENKTVRGLQELDSDTVIHPISGKKIYYCVYGINPTAAKASLAIEKANWATKIQSEKYQSRERGRADANRNAVNKAKNDKESYNKGRSERRSALAKEVAVREQKLAEARSAKIKEAKRKRKAAKAKAEANRKSKAGVYQGDADVDDDF